jgi:DUF2934 family protein
MARIRKSEPTVTVSAAGAAPVRRKAATATQKTASTPEKPRVSSTVETRAAVVEPVEVAAAPTQEKIAELAYSYWVSRGYQGGSPEEDWLRAEQELLQPALAIA